MKVALVSYSDVEGGAARATHRLHRSLLDSGVESVVRVRKKLTDDSTVVSSPPGFLGYAVGQVRRAIESRLVRLQRTDSEEMHSANALRTTWSRALNRSGADIVNIHWIGAGAMSVGDVARIRVPVVMTLHDMWAFSGAEHYGDTGPEARWRVGYAQDNRPGTSRGMDIDRWVWERKRRHWEPMQLVTPSTWLADCVGNSALTSSWPVTVIPNPLDVAAFRPTDKKGARSQLDLPLEQPIVLFGAQRASTDRRKGLDLLIRALDGVATMRPDALGVIFGEEEPARPPTTALPLRWLGHIDGDRQLAMVYGAADVMVLPSRLDNLPQTGTEAQACGTPVVAFDVGGLPDIVEHQRTGYLAQPHSAEDLARGICWVLENDERRRELARAARERAVAHWAPAVVARQYVELYDEVIEREAQRGS